MNLMILNKNKLAYLNDINLKIFSRILIILLHLFNTYINLFSEEKSFLKKCQIK